MTSSPMAQMGLRAEKGKIRILPTKSLWLSGGESRLRSLARSAAAGFTLVELLCVLALLGLVLGLVFPRFARSWEQEQVKAGLRQLVWHLKQARSAAIARQQPVKILFDFDQNIYHWDPGGPYRCPAALIDRDSALVWEDRSRRRGYLVFYRDGTSSGGQLVLAGPGPRRWLLQIDHITGKIALSHAISRETLQ